MIIGLFFSEFNQNAKIKREKKEIFTYDIFTKGRDIMASAAVSRSLSGALLTTGVVLLPIAVDAVTSMTLLALRKNYPAMSPRFCWAVSMLPAFGAAYLTSGAFQFNPSSVIKICLYFAYKALVFVKAIKVIEAGIPHPSIQLLRKKYSELINQGQLIIPVEISDEDRISLDEVALQKKEEVRQKWQDPATIQRANELIELAAQEMRNLYADLEYATSWEPAEVRTRKMAEALTSQQPPDFYRRFCSQRTFTLLDIYRAVRGLRFELKYVNQTYHLVDLEQNAQDSSPFFTEGTDQRRMRDTYNKVIDLFQPLIDEMKRFPVDRLSDVERYWHWAVRDDQQQVARIDAPSGQFKMVGGAKPT